MALRSSSASSGCCEGKTQMRSVVEKWLHSARIVAHVGARCGHLAFVSPVALTGYVCTDDHDGRLYRLLLFKAASRLLIAC